MHHAHSSLKLQETDLTKLINDVLASYQQSPPGVTVKGTGSSILCMVDPEQIKIVLKNVLENAIKYSRKESQAIRISVDKTDSWLVIEIEDTGIGIDPDVLTYIWEPFYRADKSRSRDTGGYGLGLSLCKTIIEAHGGNIDIRSTPGKGTTVSLTLPTKGEPAPPKDALHIISRTVKTLFLTDGFLKTIFLKSDMETTDEGISKGHEGGV